MREKVRTGAARIFKAEAAEQSIGLNHAIERFRHIETLYRHERALAVGRRVDLESLPQERVGNDLADSGVVVDEQDADAGHHGSVARRMNVPSGAVVPFTRVGVTFTPSLAMVW